MFELLAIWIIRWPGVMPHRLYNWALDALDRQAWRNGYECACTDHVTDRMSHLSCLERLTPECCERQSSPAIPRLAHISEDTAYAWDCGYERAVLIYRLVIDPVILLASKHCLAREPMSGLIDSMLINALSGLAKPDLRKRETVSGEMIQNQTEADIMVLLAYRKYCETVQQITGNLDYEVCSSTLRAGMKSTDPST
jgi:hypothetical protein